MPSCRGFGDCANDPSCKMKNREAHQTKTVRTYHDHQTLYSEPSWKHLRGRQLMKHPLCDRCLSYGRSVPADHVDHVTPHRGDMTLFLDDTNLQSLCLPCHSWKTTQEQKGLIHDFRNYGADLDR